MFVHPEPAEVDADELKELVEESVELPVEESVEDEDPATDVDGESVEPDVEVMPKMH